MAKHRNDRTDASTPTQSSETNHESERASDDRIRQRAYERYEERGGGHGHDMEDWLEAERDMDGGKMPRNRDQELPRRTGDSIESTANAGRSHDPERKIP
jgi:hypothetical protein